MRKIVIAAVLLSTGYVAYAGCPKGCEPHGDICACDAPGESTATVQTYKPSDERPPSDKMPSYQREGIHADMPPVSGQDQAKADATMAGRKAAGLPAQ